MLITLEKKKRIKEASLADVVVFKKDGSIVFKNSYFYHHGRTAENFSSDIKFTLINRLGIDCKIVDKYDAWKKWPKTSYFVCVIKLI